MREDLRAQETFFNVNPEPEDFASKRDAADEFIANQAKQQRKVVLVTSGGTTAPLESNTVRFLDNFSGGTRGAASTEHFLDHADYAVVFLSRASSLQPYTRHLNRNILDHLELNADSGLTLTPEGISRYRPVQQRYLAARERLLTVTFTTVVEYLWLLRGICQSLSSIGGHGVVYSAAAVADFYVPSRQLSEHKIESSKNSPQPSRPSTDSGRPWSARHNNGGPLTSHAPRGGLSLQLDPVPKFLDAVANDWAPASMVVSFKLETDSTLLLQKAHQALQKSAHELVIGNLLHSRQHEVVLVSKGDEQWIRQPSNGIPTAEIERLIVDEVIRRHSLSLARLQEQDEVHEQAMYAQALAWADSPVEG